MASSNRVAIVLPSGSAAIKASTGAHGLPITLITHLPSVVCQVHWWRYQRRHSVTKLIAASATRGSPERGGSSRSSR